MRAVCLLCTSQKFPIQGISVRMEVQVRVLCLPRVQLLCKHVWLHVRELSQSWDKHSNAAGVGCKARARNDWGTC